MEPRSYCLLSCFEQQCYLINACASVCLQQPYLFKWTNHLRTGAYAMAANTALLLTINMYADAEAQLPQGYTEQQLLAARADRSAQFTLYMFALLPVALLAGIALSWLRLRLWVRPALKKFRWEGIPPKAFAFRVHVQQRQRHMLATQPNTKLAGSVFRCQWKH